MAIRIMHVMAGGTVGGAENIFLEDILALAESKEVEQYVVTRPAAYRLEKLAERGVPFKTASFRMAWPWSTRRTLRKAVQEFKPDIIQYWMGRAGSFAVPGDHVNVAWYGGYYHTKKRFSNCAHHMVLTRDLARHVRESGVNDNDISIVHTMASFPDRIMPQPRDELNTPEDATVLLTLARLHEKKGLDVLLKAMVHLPRCVAWIAGDGPLKNELAKMADDLNVTSRVRFLGWRNDRERLLKSADLCVFPSRFEPFGTVMVDAWAMEVPLIAADAQGPAAYIKHGENGYLIPKNNVEALVSGINTLIADKALCDKMAAGGLKTYQQNFTKEAFLRDSLDVYRKLAKRA